MQVERRSFVPAYERAQATVEGQRAGVLCAMTEDEKTQAVRSCSESEEFALKLNESLVAAARSQSVHAKPVRSLEQLLNKIPVADLRRALRNYGAQGTLVSALKKKDMIALLSLGHVVLRDKGVNKKSPQGIISPRREQRRDGCQVRGAGQVQPDVALAAAQALPRPVALSIIP